MPGWRYNPSYPAPLGTYPGSGTAKKRRRRRRRKRRRRRRRRRRRNMADL